MKIISTIVVVILVALALLSGIFKVMLMPQEVEFFGKYGFTNSLLMAFGAVQLLGGGLMTVGKTRAIGALLVAATFIVSLILLLMEGNLPVSIVTAIATLLLCIVIKRSLGTTSSSSN